MRNRERTNFLASRIAAAGVVAVGIASVWFVIAMWAGSLVTNIISPRTSVYETITVTQDGAPIVNTYSDLLLTGRRTLDGRPHPLNSEEWLYGAHLPPPYEPPGVFDTRFPWNRWPGRITGETDGKQNPTAWYLVRDDEQTGEVYLAGYDCRTQKCAGYIGREGFQATKPSASEEFLVPKSSPQDGLQFVTGGRSLRPLQLLSGQQILEDFPSMWTVTLLETNRICGIDLRERTVNTDVRVENAVAFSGVTASTATFDQLTVEEKNFGSQTSGNKEADKNWDERDLKPDNSASKFVGLTMVREQDRLVATRLVSHNWKEFLLPENLRDRAFTAYLVGPNEVLLWVYGRFDENWSGGPISRLIWINSQGQVRHEQELRLAGEVGPSVASIAWRGSVCVPSPIVWVVGFFVGAPTFGLQSNLFNDFASSFYYTASNSWVPLVLVVLVGLACAAIAFRLQQKHRRPNAFAWVAFAFVFGPVGVLAYVIEQRRAKLEACSQCGMVVPRDRNSCAACDAEFMPPARLGTEIFA